MILRMILFAFGGAAAGFAYQRLVGCRTGTCAITSNPYVAAVYGASVGYAAPHRGRFRMDLVRRIHSPSARTSSSVISKPTSVAVAPNT